MTGGYLLVLLALRLAPVSYVAPARELSIVIGTVPRPRRSSASPTRPRASPAPA